MTVFYMTLCSVFMFSLLARLTAKSTPIGPVYVAPNKVSTFIVISILVLVSGLENNIGDTVFYMYSYSTTQFTLDSVLFKADFGFNVLQILLQQISNNPQLLIFVVALITNVLILVVLYKYSKLFELSLFLYITTGMYLVSMNGIRQFLAAAFLFAATKYIFDGNWKKYMIVVLFAATIHQSALILIPIYYIVRRKAWTKQTYLLLAVAMVVVVGYGLFSQALFTVIKDTKYGEYQNLETHGANFLRVIVTVIPLIIAYLGREKLRSLFPKSDYIVNMCLINAVVMLISTQQWIFARFSIYFGLYNLILIPWIIKLFVPKHQKLVYYAIVVFYFIYYYYEEVISLNMIYRSDYIKF
jgi:transmembrane protein EpsG